MANGFRALLIGVPTYADPMIGDLLFVQDDVAELAVALRGVGYDVTVHDSAHTDRDSVDQAVELFIDGAKPGQTLLVYLSGHGIHHGGTDYLVPRTAMIRSRDFPARCVAIDFDGYVERSQAGDVVVFVDACREGVDLREMGIVNAAGWSTRRVMRTGSRRFAYVYACSPGERARYATAGTKAFSLFSRALGDAVADGQGPATLAAVESAVQNAVDTLAAEHQLPRQQVRVLTETDKDGFVVFPRPEHPEGGAARGEHPWAASARDHVAWKQVEGGPGADALREATSALVEDLASGWERDRVLLRDDPWRDDTFAERFNGKVRWLLTAVLNPGKLGLSPAEAALLAAFPFLQEAFWTRRAAEARHVAPEDPVFHGAPGERAGFERFAAGHGRLRRRAARAAETGDHAAAAGIGWWLFHRWLTRRPDCYQSSHLAGLVSTLQTAGAGGLARQVFAAGRLVEMLRALRVDAAFLNQPERDAGLRSSRLIASSTDVEQMVREQLLGFLLATAYRFALDPRTVPDVVVDHLGISYAVSLPEMHATLAAATWEPHGRTRVLAASCGHPAVDLALREQVGAVDRLLGAIDVAASEDGPLAPLADLPTHATADRVRAAPTTDGGRAYDSTGFRVRLADDRIQELLMGEQLLR